MLLFLMTVAPDGQARGIEYLYKKHHRDMLIYAKAVLRREGWESYEFDAEDVVQRTYIKLMQKGTIDFSKSECEIKAYAVSTVHSVALDYIRENGKYANDAELDETLDISDESFFAELDIKERYREVVEAIKQLDLIYGSTLFLTAEGMTPAEIASHMGVSEQTVYTRLRRARAELLKILKEKNYDGKN